MEIITRSPFVDNSMDTEQKLMKDDEKLWDTQEDGGRDGEDNHGDFSGFKASCCRVMNLSGSKLN